MNFSIIIKIKILLVLYLTMTLVYCLADKDNDCTSQNDTREESEDWIADIGHGERHKHNGA